MFKTTFSTLEYRFFKPVRKMDQKMGNRKIKGGIETFTQDQVSRWLMIKQPGKLR